MKFAVIVALFALVAVTLAQPVANEEGSPVAAPEKVEAAEPSEPAASADGNKDLDTANSYLYGGYGYPAYYGGYGYYPYGGYYGGYGAYGIPAYGYGLYY